MQLKACQEGLEAWDERRQQDSQSKQMSSERDTGRTEDERTRKKKCEV